MAANLFPRYIWLAETIYNAGPISKLDIDRAWISSPLNTDGDEEYETRSFHRHKDAIAELFGLTIDCDRLHGNLYYMPAREKMSAQSFQRWLTDNFAIINLTAESQDLQARVAFEPSEVDPSGLRRVVDAMHNNEVLHVRHGDWEYQLEPYGLRQYRNKWYLVATKHDETDTPTYWPLAELAFIRDIHPLHFRMPRRFNLERFIEENPIGKTKKAKPATEPKAAKNTNTDTKKATPQPQEEPHTRYGEQLSLF